MPTATVIMPIVILRCGSVFAVDPVDQMNRAPKTSRIQARIINKPDAISAIVLPALIIPPSNSVSTNREKGYRLL
jgi:hypothetical protein